MFWAYGVTKIYKYIFKLDKRTATDLIFLLFKKKIYKNYINDINLHHSTLNKYLFVVAFVCFILEAILYFLYIFNLKIFFTLIFSIHTYNFNAVIYIYRQFFPLSMQIK